LDTANRHPIGVLAFRIRDKKLRIDRMGPDILKKELLLSSELAAQLALLCFQLHLLRLLEPGNLCPLF
jgi:hypothetical protein